MVQGNEEIKMDYRDFTRIGLEAERKKLIRCIDTIKTAPAGRLILRKNVNGHRRYYIALPEGKAAKYAGKKMMITVYKIKQRKKAEIMLKILKNNIKIREYVLENYKDYSDTAIDEFLTPAYRTDEELNEKVFQQAGINKKVHQSENPYRPEELRHITSFNLRVRSKGELIIAEALYAGGFEFYYEKRLELYREDGSIKVIYPDFTIIFPGGFVVYWEHKGRIDDRDYMLHDIEKTQLYYRNGIFEPHNLIVTTDGPGNMTDMEAFNRIINGLLKPLLGI